MSDAPDPPSLEETLAQYVRSAGNAPLDLKRLLNDRPEVASQLRKLLEEHERAATSATLAHQPNGHEGAAAETTPPEFRGLDAPTLMTPAVAAAEERVRRETSESLDVQNASFGAAQINSAHERFGDYRLVEEIARGGMGVVYRARQISLDRPVALKMILAGQLAAQGDVARFYAEAESAAQLDHPGIVPIYEVGQHEGQHFYAMGYVEGRSLADLIAAGPLPNAHAAALLEQVAVAVEYAHEQGVIHRDLKPANVLLDKQGQPRVTDFGLAKRLDRDSQLTAHGQVLGTPSYMPPEQASGQLDRIGPASDVYALGGVLYAMLTGRPPFQAAAPVDTLMQVLQRDPVPPRQLNPEVDRDLETICLKCLEKDPPDRYHRARDVIADVKRYQRGEPLSARPISPWELLIRWYKRLRKNEVVRVRSTGGLGRLPWVDIAVGPDSQTGQSRGVARGVIAIGDTAWGVIAMGESARGFLALGRTCYGVFSFGERAVGLVAVGAVAVGFVSFAACALGVVALGGIATGWVTFGGLSVGYYALGAMPIGKYALGAGRNDPGAENFFEPWFEVLTGN